jgi:carboxylate-amine ligase
MEFDNVAHPRQGDMLELEEAPAGSLARPAETGYSFGVEEEYFLAHQDSMDVVTQAPAALFDMLEKTTWDRASHESLQAQIEVSTEPHNSAGLLKDQLRFLRTAAATVAEKHGFTILAAGTHPTAKWEQVAPTVSERYCGVMDALQMIGRRNMLCGMHVHVELPDPDRRVDVMVRMLPFLPLFLALSTSSPFWRSRPTGLKGYRLAAYDELPRTGLPELFPDNAAYDRYVAALVDSGVIEDASHIWWMVRPSLQYPTLELRAPDCCTRLDDAVAIACLFRALVRHLFRNPGLNADITEVDRAIAVENKWRAQRFGVQDTFASRTGPVAVGDYLDRLLATLDDDVDALGCAEEMRHCRTIVPAGTSADMQLKIYGDLEREGRSPATRAVASWVAETTRAC